MEETFGQEVISMSKLKEFIGYPTINPIVFYSGKFAGYITWAVLLISLRRFRFDSETGFNEYGALLLMVAGLLISLVSLVNLGKSTRFGLPITMTVLKTKGLYRFSRNPVYVGFNLLTLAAMLYTLNLLINLMGLYSIIVDHFIILAEERFLARRFRKDYDEYRQKIRRYL
jgi:steroid 5-alpha reductase family enzyme